MHGTESGGPTGLLPRPLTDDERVEVRQRLATEFPRLQRTLDAAKLAACETEPEAALVFLGILVARASHLIFPR